MKNKKNPNIFYVSQPSTIYGMLLILNKIIWKIPEEYKLGLLVEASDIPGYNKGYFTIDELNESVIYRMTDGKTIYMIKD